MLCPKCGEDNPERFSFCGACGSPLEATPVSTAEERKVVSVLFVDLVGFTASSEHADPEDVRARLRRYHSMLKREIERFGGTVEKFIGDAVMAVFGAPVTHEDDAERAVRAALRITEAIGELNEEDPELDLAVRAAVNTGEAVVALGANPAQGEGMVTGDVVNTASRLQGVAPVGGVAVGEVTYRSTKDAIEYAALDPVSVKGKQEAVPLWHALRARGRYTAEIERVTTPFIGRQAELSMLQQTFARAVQEPSVQLVTVMGEPGVGKSRLTSEFFTWVDEQPDMVSWRHGRCLPYGEGVTFWAVGEIVKAHAGILESDSPQDTTRKVGEAVDAVIEQGSEREWVKSRLAPLVGSGTEATVTERSETFTAWRTFFEAVAAARPLVILVEDLHWADDSMLEFVDHLVDWVTGVPLLVLCTARPELFERHPGWGGGKRNSATIGLSPLSGDETARLLSALLSETVLPAETQRALLERAGGNPLYAEEFVRMLLDRGILVHRGAAIELATSEAIPVPDSVHALIAARLDTLSPDRKALMHDAAVIGKVFWSDALATMTGRSLEEVQTGMHELARKELVRPARKPSIEGQTEYSFWHILVRDVAYSQIPRAARAAKHQAAAKWIESIAGARVGDHAEILAFHYLEALELARATGTADEQALLSERAIQFLMLSGERAFSLDLAKAESFYRRALQLVPGNHPLRGKILLQIARAEGDRGQNDETVRDFEEAIAMLQSAGDRIGAGDAHTRLARLRWRRGETTQSHAMAVKAVELLESEAPSAELAYAYSEIASFSMLAGSHDDAIRYAGKAIEVSELQGMQAPIVNALTARGVSLTELGRLDEGIGDLRRALSLGTDLGLGLETAKAYGNLAAVIEGVEGVAISLELVRMGAELAQRRGLSYLEMWLRAGAVSGLVTLGRWDEALAGSEEILRWEQDKGQSQLRLICLVDRARVCLDRGRLEEAAMMVETLLPPAREVGDPQMVVPALSIAAQVKVAQGDHIAASELMRELGSATERNSVWRFNELAPAVRVLIECNAIKDAAALIETLSPRTRWERANLVSAHAMLNEARAEFEDGLARYQEASEAWAAHGHALELARAIFGEGRCLVQLGRTHEAAGRLRAARESFVTLGAGSLTAEADEWLARATALSS